MVLSHSGKRAAGGWRGNTGTRHERGYGSTWDKLRKKVLERDMYLCQACKRDGILTPLGVKPYDHAVDHIKPKAKGGTDDEDNLEGLCADCHDAKTEREAKEGQGARPRPQFDDKGFPVWE